MMVLCSACKKPVDATFTPREDRRLGQTGYAYQCPNKGCGNVGTFNDPPTADRRLGQ